MCTTAVMHSKNLLYYFQKLPLAKPSGRSLNEN
jgi:hypothetical protein